MTQRQKKSIILYKFIENKIWRVLPSCKLKNITVFKKIIFTNQTKNNTNNT